MTAETDVLSQLREIVTDVLCRSARLPEPLGSACAGEIVAMLCVASGGDKVYLPKRDRKRLRTEVLAAFNGNNRDELCVRYGISRGHFYRLLNARSAHVKA